MYPTEFTCILYDKCQDFFTSIASRILSLCQYWLKWCLNLFSKFQSLRLLIYDPITVEMILHFFQIHQRHSSYDKQRYFGVSLHHYKLIHARPFSCCKLSSQLVSHKTILLSSSTQVHLDHSLFLEVLIHFVDFLLLCNVPTPDLVTSALTRTHFFQSQFKFLLQPALFNMLSKEIKILSSTLRLSLILVVLISLF